jgi:hypothetical protein
VRTRHGGTKSTLAQSCAQEGITPSREEVRDAQRRQERHREEGQGSTAGEKSRVEENCVEEGRAKEARRAEARGEKALRARGRYAANERPGAVGVCASPTDIRGSRHRVAGNNCAARCGESGGDGARGNDWSRSTRIGGQSATRRVNTPRAFMAPISGLLPRDALGSQTAAKG